MLWHLEVEGDSPADIAPLFGLTANAVSALGYRAREGLRQAYLQEHLAGGGAAASPRDRRHREAEEKLGAYTRGGLSKRDAAKVEDHLRECAECRALAAELREVNSGILRSTIAPLVLGAALVGYLADRAAPGFLTGSWPTTAEWFVAGGGVVGVLGAVGGAVRTAEVPRARRLGAAAVGLAGLGVATATALGSGTPAVPEAAPSVTFPGPLLPGTPLRPRPEAPGPPGEPGPGVSLMPGVPGVPGVPGSGAQIAPGSALPSVPGSSAPTRPEAEASPARRAVIPEAVIPEAVIPGRHPEAVAPDTTSDDASARRTDVTTSGTVTSGTWSSGTDRGAEPASTRRRPSADSTRENRRVSTPLVTLRVLGVGAELRETRAHRSGPLDPALDVLLR